MDANAGNFVADVRLDESDEVGGCFMCSIQEKQHLYICLPIFHQLSVLLSPCVALKMKGDTFAPYSRYAWNYYASMLLLKTMGRDLGTKTVLACPLEILHFCRCFNFLSLCQSLRNSYNLLSRRLLCWELQ